MGGRPGCFSLATALYCLFSKSAARTGWIEFHIRERKTDGALLNDVVKTALAPSESRSGVANLH
eukprot:5325151-Lingulodinium_polyedra.AAC.1